MGTIRYDYDTAAVRTEARKLKKCFDRLNGSEIQRVKNVRARLDDGFEGSAAAALDGRLVQIQTEVRQLSGEIYSLYVGLMKYADALEKADESIAQMLGK